MAFAFLFPGQGSQSLNMMDGFAAAVVKDTFDEASDALGDDLWAMLKADSNEAINQTINTQPLMLAAGVAAFRAWLAAGGARPSVVAGHSLGEYSALVAADALDFDDAVRQMLGPEPQYGGDRAPLVQAVCDLRQGLHSQGRCGVVGPEGPADGGVNAIPHHGHRHRRPPRSDKAGLHHRRLRGQEAEQKHAKRQGVIVPVVYQRMGDPEDREQRHPQTDQEQGRPDQQAPAGERALQPRLHRRKAWPRQSQGT